ncbi:hypothetical protein HPULCUR_010361 [Helicostylum pulchrum]|uniref:MULE transposase domain-containing protein n=1 Tax=Helicostylum pulchrum TaxID=562976 RepID=A0ABP9YD08_9FUNG
MPLCMLFTASKPGYILKQLQSMRRTRPTHTSSISVKIVGTGNTSSIKGTNRLQIFVIAAAFVSYETEQSYTWIMEELRGDVWPVDTDFPESQHLLCAWHLWNTMECLLKEGEIERRVGLKRALGNQSAARLTLVCERMHAYYEQKV